MPAGDLITRSGQVEWQGLLFDLTSEATGGSEVWLPNTARRSGWHPRMKRAVYPTEDGGVGGRPLWEPMFPAIDGVACDTAEALNLLLSYMDPLFVTEPAELVWWSAERDEVLSAMALPEHANPVELNLVAHAPTRFVDVMWFVGSPGEIISLTEAESS